MTHYADPNDQGAADRVPTKKLQDQQIESTVMQQVASVHALPGALPTHRCKTCGALWRFWRAEETSYPTDSWNLRSLHCCKDCDGRVEREHLEPLDWTHLKQVDLAYGPDMTVVASKDANNFCKIVAVLGLEEDEETDIVETIKLLLENEGSMLELANRTLEWHEARLTQLRDIQEQIEEGTSVQVGSDSSAEKQIKLSAREASVFKLGMQAGLACFETPPFTLGNKGDADDEGDEE